MMRLTERMLLIALLVLTAGIAVLAPETANAHSQYVHQPSHVDASGPAHAGSQAPEVHAGLSQSCPAVPGRWCCCGSLLALSGGGKAAASGSDGWSLALDVGSGGTGFKPRAQLPPSAALPSRARPRAPPAFP
jgi:hypothetical protein